MRSLNMLLLKDIFAGSARSNKGVFKAERLNNSPAKSEENRYQGLRQNAECSAEEDR